MGNVKRQSKGRIVAAASALTAIAFLWASVAFATQALLTGDTLTLTGAFGALGTSPTDVQIYRELDAKLGISCVGLTFDSPIRFL